MLTHLFSDSVNFNSPAAQRRWVNCGLAWCPLSMSSWTNLVHRSKARVPPEKLHLKRSIKLCYSTRLVCPTPRIHLWQSGRVYSVRAIWDICICIGSPPTIIKHYNHRRWYNWFPVRLRDFSRRSGHWLLCHTIGNPRFSQLDALGRFGNATKFKILIKCKMENVCWNNTFSLVLNRI